MFPRTHMVLNNSIILKEHLHTYTFCYIQETLPKLRTHTPYSVVTIEQGDSICWVMLELEY